MSDTVGSSRDTLVKSAIALIAEKGYHGTSMSDLENVSGLGRSSIYHYFKNKEALLAEICSVSTRRQAQIARAIVEENAPAREALFRLINALMTEIIRNRQAALISLREINFLTGEYRSVVLKHRIEYESYWRLVLQRAVKETLIKGFSEFDLNAILGMVNYSAIWIHRVTDQRIETMAERFTLLALHGLVSSKGSG